MQLPSRVRAGVAATAALALLGGVLGVAPPALAQSGTPTPTTSVGGPSAVPAARFFGSVKVGSNNAPDGTTVVASISGVACGYGTVNGGQYFVDVQSIAGCSTPGANVNFAVGGQTSSTTGTLPGVPGAVQLNLAVSQATATPAPTASAAAAAPTPPPPPSRPTTAPQPPAPPTARTATPRAATPTPRATAAGAGRQGVTAQKPVAAKPAVARPVLPKTGTGDSAGSPRGLAAALAGVVALALAGFGAIRLRRTR